MGEIGGREHLWITSLEPLGKCIFNLFLLLSLPRSNKWIMPQRRAPSQQPEREAITRSFALPLKSAQIRKIPFGQHLLLLVSWHFCLSSSKKAKSKLKKKINKSTTWPADQFYSRLLQQTGYCVWILSSQLDYKCLIDWKYLRMHIQSRQVLLPFCMKIIDIKLRYIYSDT